MSIEAWNQWIAELQQYLVVFDAPTRYFLYGLSIGILILSLTFTYYMSKISFELVVNLVTEIFKFLKFILVDLPLGLMKAAFQREESPIPPQPEVYSAEPVEA